LAFLIWGGLLLVAFPLVGFMMTFLSLGILGDLFAASSPTLISGVENFRDDADDLFVTIGTLIELVFCLLTASGFLGL
jgi:hypothetical protein